MHDRLPQRHARGDYVEEAPDRECREEHDCCERGIHDLAPPKSRAPTCENAGSPPQVDGKIDARPPELKILRWLCFRVHTGPSGGEDGQSVEESKVALSVKRTRAVLEPSRTVIVMSFTGRLAGVPEQLAGGPAE
jgi:hypothetical protein